MAKTFMCDADRETAAKAFKTLNAKDVQLKYEAYELFIVTDVEPKDLIYPAGWYYAKGTFRNKHTSTTGMYDEVVMLKKNGDLWEDSATYCTLK